MEYACLSLQSKLSKEEINRVTWVTGHPWKQETPKNISLWATNSALQASTRATKLHIDSYFGLIKNTFNLQVLFGRRQFLPQASKVFEPHFSLQEEPYPKAFHCKI